MICCLSDVNIRSKRNALSQTMSRPRLLIINADDFGYCPERNRGIVECFQAGGAGSATLMVNAVASQDAANKIKEHNIPAGLHLNLIEGKPISTNSPSLVGPDGWMHGVGEFRRRLRAGLIPPEHIGNEVQAQISEFQRLVGRKPTHVDGHQHAHLMEGVREVFSEVLLRNDVDKTRQEAEIGLEDAEWIENKRGFLRIIEASRAAKPVFKAAGVKFPDEFYGLATMFNWMTPERLKMGIMRAFQAAESGSGGSGQTTVELMVHPGYPSRPGVGGVGQGPDEFSLSPDRKMELDTLVSREMLDWYQENNITLGNFSQLGQN